MTRGYVGQHRTGTPAPQLVSELRQAGIERHDGPISGRLRDTFGENVADWPAHREPEAVRDMPEDEYAGRTLSPNYRRIGDHDTMPADTSDPGKDTDAATP